MDVTKNVKMAAAGTALAGALSFGFIGVSSGLAAAKPDSPNPNPPGPGVSAPANPGNGHGNGNGNGNQGGNGYQGGSVNGDDNDNGGTWGGGNVNPAWVPGMPPGQNPFGPPGLVMQMPALTLTNPLDLGNGTVLPAGTMLPTNPFANTPPGQWGSVDLIGFINQLDPTTVTWLPPDSGLSEPLPLVWNAETNQWGITVNGVFTPYPDIFPAPGTTG